MNRTRFSVWAMPVALAALIALCVPLQSHAGNRSKNKEKAIEFDDIALFFELNDTDEDLGVQMKLGSEPFRRLQIYDPCGHKLLDMKAKGDLRTQGLSEMFFESAEPSLDDVTMEEILARFPKGKYRFVGRTLDGTKLEGKAELSHDIPDAPVILAPGDGDEVAAEDLTIEWLEVTTPAGIEIASYQVIVTSEEDSQFKYDIRMPSNATSVTVPGEFLESGVEYELEILAVAENGNQTIGLIFFTVEE